MCLKMDEELIKAQQATYFGGNADEDQPVDDNSKKRKADAKV